MSTRPAQRTAAPNATHGSMTITGSEAGPSTPFNLPTRTLRLRAEPSERRRIQWADDVIDNEGMGKKSSKVCCIYHKPREAGESSSDSSDSDSSDSEPDTSRAQPAKRRARSTRHQHHDGEPCQYDDSPEHAPGKDGRKQKPRTSSPNAYERVPKRKSPKGKEPEG